MQSSENNLAIIESKIKEACVRVGRSRDEVTLIWVSKTKSIEAVEWARNQGATNFGENRLQEGVEKFCKRPENEDLHIIGPVQSNKLRKVALLADYLHTVSTEKQLNSLQRICEEENVSLKVFIQVNTSGEASKAGVSLSEIESFLQNLKPRANLLYSGLMTIASNIDSTETIRHEFRELAKLRDQFLNSKSHFENFKDLSMGMSKDFEVAIEEGSTFIRIGTALFGTRN